VKRPAEIVAAIANLDSDWVRYGLPAVLLTVIFFSAMRFEAGKVEPPSAPPVSARNPLPPRTGSFSVSPLATEDHPRAASGNFAPGMAAMQQPIGIRPGVPFVHPPAAAFSNPQVEGRRAVCGTAQLIIARGKRRRLILRARQIAIATYRGQGGPQAAEQAVNRTIDEYKHGIWSESQCPAAPGMPPLPKGAIAELIP